MLATPNRSSPGTDKVVLRLVEVNDRGEPQTKQILRSTRDAPLVASKKPQNSIWKDGAPETSQCSKNQMLHDALSGWQFKKPGVLNGGAKRLPKG
jgi:hypothetical protein